jgi:hypothetical protein
LKLFEENDDLELELGLTDWFTQCIYFIFILYYL